MCFSATASFAADALPIGLRMRTLKSASRPRELLFGAIPLAVRNPTVERRRDLVEASAEGRRCSTARSAIWLPRAAVTPGARGDPRTREPIRHTRGGI